MTKAICPGDRWQSISGKLYRVQALHAERGEVSMRGPLPAKGIIYVQWRNLENENGWTWLGTAEREKER